jgi:hypothetical protein
MMRSGEAIYAVQCAARHAPDGSGVDGLFPMLKGSALVHSTRGVAGLPKCRDQPGAYGGRDAVIRVDAERIRGRRGVSPVDAATIGKTRRALEERND